MPPLNRNITCLLLLVLSPWGIAQSNNDPIRISADEATRSERDGVTRYLGNVILVQGPITISASSLEIDQADVGQTKIIATGSPATFVQPQLGEDPAIDAQALVIRYEQIARKVILEQDARIKRGDSIISGPLIEYFIDEKRVQAGQDANQPKRRIEVVIPSSDGGH